MSWSIYADGTKQELQDAIEKQRDAFTVLSLSQAEFAEVTGLLESLIREHGDGSLRLEASGHASADWNAPAADQISNRTHTTISIRIFRKE